MSNDLLDFDFGFTAVDEDELEAVQSVKAEAGTAAATSQQMEEGSRPLHTHLQ